MKKIFGETHLGNIYVHTYFFTYPVLLAYSYFIGLKNRSRLEKITQFLGVQYYHNLECMRDKERERVRETETFQIYKMRAVFRQERVEYNLLTD